VQGAAVSQAVFGERTGLERVFLEHQGRVFRAAYRITGNAQDAEDVLQTVFLRLARRARRRRARRGEPAELPLSRGDQHRARPAAGTPRSGGRAAGGGGGRPTAGRSLPTRRRRPPRSGAGCAWRWPRCPTALADDIFVLRYYFEDQANRDIARTLGISRVTVAVTLHRARRHLQDQLRA